MSAPALPKLLAPEQFATQLRAPHVLVVDLSQAQVHRQAHVPGAVHVDFRRTQLGMMPAPGNLPSVAALSELLSGIGLTADTHVVACDDEGGGWAGRFLWLLEMVGHQKWSYLDGGIHAWLAAGLPIEQTINEPTASGYVARIVGTAGIDKAGLLELLDDPELAIWDARSADEYAGVRALAARAGHIPGAVNLDWVECMDRNRALRLKDPEQLRATLAALGITTDRNIVTHCQTHHRSGLTWLVGSILGFPRMRAYAGSWSEWGNDPTTPIRNDLQGNLQ